MLGSMHLLMLSQSQCQTKKYEQTRNPITSRQRCSAIDDGNQVLPAIKNKPELVSRMLVNPPPKKTQMTK